MTDTPTPPDGWYPDPAGSGGLRRWNGTAWTDDVRPPAAAPETATPAEPVAEPEAEPAAPVADTPPVPPVAPPVPPVAPTVPPTAPAAADAAAPAYASAPAYPGAPAYPAAPPQPGATTSTGSGIPASPVAPGYPSAPAAAAPARADVSTNTVWIWLAVALPLLSVLTLFLFDWSTYIQESVYASAFPEEAPYLASSSLAVTAGTSIFSLIIVALTVLFAFLDWRQLRARGIQKPFHWAWSFTVLAISSIGVYVIGRAVILRRQTGTGLAPVWGWIAVTLVTIIAASIWVVTLFSAIIPILEQLQYATGY